MIKRKQYVKELEPGDAGLCLYIEDTGDMYEVWIGIKNYGIRYFAVGMYKKDVTLKEISSFDYSIEIELFMEMYDKIEGGIWQ